MKVSNETNILRVFRLPAEYPKYFCIGVGHPVVFHLVDWIYPFSPTENYGQGKDIPDKEYKLHIKMIKEFIKGKIYAKDGQLLAITDYGDAFIV